jgi:hypothetical protein
VTPADPPPGLRDRDERRHPPGGVGWSEVWSFDLLDPATGLGLSLAVELAGDPVRAAVRAAVVGPGRSLVSLVADDLPVPRAGLELRGPGIWVAPECETPFDHWSLGLEAFAVTLEDPWEALAGARGDRTPLGADLEWETLRHVGTLPGPGTGYEEVCRVHGELLVGPERWSVDGAGTRAHRWGSAATGSWRRHRLDGTATPVELDGRPVRPDDLRSPGLEVVADGRVVPLEVLATAPFPGRGGSVVRALVAAPGGWGWLLAGAGSAAPGGR